jgi:hypothetical protein
MKKKAKEIIRLWRKKNVDKREVKSFSHWQFRSYVIGYAASGCLITTSCWVDSEPLVRKDNKKHPLNLIRLFDDSLKAGDWCFTCYIVVDGCQEGIALPLELLYK